MSDDNNDDKRNVIDLAAKKAKREKGSGKLPKAEAYRAISEAIDRLPHSALPPFPKRYYAVEFESGVRNVLWEKEDGIVEYVCLNAVAIAIHNYTNLLRPRPDFIFETRHSEAAARDWLSRTTPIAEPRPIAWKDEEGLTFRRLPWRFAPDFTGEKTPVFNELFSRMSNSKAVIDWIGSLFFPESNRQQYVWIYGEGQNGKGSLAYFLGSVFGGTFRALQPPTESNKHWTASLIGARLGVFSDCNKYGFVTSGLFKSLTGNDRVIIDRKGKDTFTAELSVKFLILSNKQPALSSAKSDLRRAIYCEMQSLPEGADVEDGYQKRLWEEGGAFLSTCIHNYSTAYPQHGPIKVDNFALDEIVEQNEEPLETIADRSFDFSHPEAVCSAADFQEVLNEHFKTEKQKRDFRAFLRRKYGAGQSKPTKIAGKVVKMYTGFRRTHDWRRLPIFKGHYREKDE